jgi:hypothetical protein
VRILEATEVHGSEQKKEKKECAQTRSSTAWRGQRVKHRRDEVGPLDCRIGSAQSDEVEWSPLSPGWEGSACASPASKIPTA